MNHRLTDPLFVTESIPGTDTVKVKDGMWLCYTLNYSHFDIKCSIFKNTEKPSYLNFVHMLDILNEFRLQT